MLPAILKEGLLCEKGVGRGKNKIFLGDTIATCCNLLPGNNGTYHVMRMTRNIINNVKSPVVREQYIKQLRPIYKAAAIIAVDMSGIEWKLSPCGVPSIIERMRESNGEEHLTFKKNLTEYISREDISPERISLYSVIQFYAQVWEGQLETGWSYEPDTSIPDERTIIIE